MRLSYIFRDFRRSLPSSIFKRLSEWFVAGEKKNMIIRTGPNNLFFDPNATVIKVDFEWSWNSPFNFSQ